MYIPFDKIGRTLGLFFPKYSYYIIKFFNGLKISANCRYINKNQKTVLKRIKKKFGKEPLKVVFYVYEPCRWKSQSIYDLMAQDERFEPLIVVTKNRLSNQNPNCQSAEDIKNTYQFFKDKNMNVTYGYDIENEQFIPFKNFNPDLIFYSHPWYVETSQGPVVCSKFALTYYVPYFVANTPSDIDYNLRFHQYIHRHYVLNEEIKSEYEKGQERKSNNFAAVGHPQLDFFYLNKENCEKKYVIYSPHWSILGESQSFATFEWNGKYILEFAKKHPEINWVFKPHPLLFKQTIASKFMTQEEVQEYYDSWKSIAKYCDDGNYMSLFKESYAMITDCGSFLTEYFMSKNPVIHLVSPDAWEYNNNVKQIVKSYYQAHNLEELEKYLQEIIIDKKDYKKQERLDLLEKLQLSNNYCAGNIIKNLEQEFSA